MSHSPAADAATMDAAPLSEAVATTTTTTKTTKSAAPQLLFDDGSRVMQDLQQQQQQQESRSTATVGGHGRDPSVSIHEYYEIARMGAEIRRLQSTSSTTWRGRIALQFPDALLGDAPDVCWALEEELLKTSSSSSFVFVLGDTTYQACCPDPVAAAHLEADVVVHYGHACLSPCDSVPVLYSIHSPTTTNVSSNLPAAAQSIMETARRARLRHLLILYQVEYHATIIPQLVQALESINNNNNKTVSRGSDNDDDGTWSLQIAVGTLPPLVQTATTPTTTTTTTSATTCNSSSCCQSPTTTSAETPASAIDTTTTTSSSSSGCQQAEDLCCHPPPETPTTNPFYLSQLWAGGLQIPWREMQAWNNNNTTNKNDDEPLSYAFLFVGDDHSRAHFNIVLQFLSWPILNKNDDDDDSTSKAQQQLPPPAQYWTWNPFNNTSNNKDSPVIATDLSPRFQRTLQRRFYVIQKARLARVVGIVVANLSDSRLQQVVRACRQLVMESGDRTAYVVAVGKLNPAKLANFAEIDCFVLVACPEHSLLLDQEREFATPLLTPLELAMAMGHVEWGQIPYSLTATEFLLHVQTTLENNNHDDDDDDDVPYFNPVTGHYEMRHIVSGTNNNNTAITTSSSTTDLTVLPGHGTLTMYNSAAADFLKQREYKGLQVQHGQTPVHEAQPGQEGIASYYQSTKEESA